MSADAAGDGRGARGGATTGDPRSNVHDAPLLPPRLVLAVGVLSVGVSAILVRATDDVPARSIAFYRLFFTTCMLAPAAFWFQREGFARMRPRELLVSLAIGVVLAVHFAAWIESLFLTTIASSVIIVSLECILAAIGAMVFLGERSNARGITGIVAAFLGVTLLAAEDAGRGAATTATVDDLPFDALRVLAEAGLSLPLIGDLLAFIGAIAAAIYLVTGRHVRQRVPLLVYVTVVYWACSLTLFGYAMATDAPLTGFSGRDWSLLVAMAIIPTIGGHTAFNWCLRWLPTSTVSTSILGEPIIASVLAALLFHETPGTIGLVGMAVTLLGILLVLRSESTPDARTLGTVEGTAIAEELGRDRR